MSTFLLSTVANLVIIVAAFYGWLWFGLRKGMMSSGPSVGANVFAFVVVMAILGGGSFYLAGATAVGGLAAAVGLLVLFLYFKPIAFISRRPRIKK